MGLSPLYVGETHITWSLTWKDDAGTAINLTGATLSGVLQPALAGNSTDIILGGAFAIVSAINGTFTYAPVAGDLAVRGDYLIQFKAVFGDATVLYADPIALTIKAIL